MRHQNLMNQIKQFNKVLGKVIKAIRQAEVKTVVEITVTNRSCKSCRLTGPLAKEDLSFSVLNSRR